eukprot:19571-Chlamydomonas_euryale.AAC.5
MHRGWRPGPITHGPVAQPHTPVACCPSHTALLRNHVRLLHVAQPSPCPLPPAPHLRLLCLHEPRHGLIVALHALKLQRQHLQVTSMGSRQRGFGATAARRGARAPHGGAARRLLPGLDCSAARPVGRCAAQEELSAGRCARGAVRLCPRRVPCSCRPAHARVAVVVAFVDSRARSLGTQPPGSWQVPDEPPACFPHALPPRASLLSRGLGFQADWEPRMGPRAPELGRGGALAVAGGTGCECECAVPCMAVRV